MPDSSDKADTEQELQLPAPQEKFEHGTVVAESLANAVDPNRAVVEHAIEAIGMGRYQVNMTILCGFGFVVDQASRADLLEHVVSSLLTSTDAPGLH